MGEGWSLGNVGGGGVGSEGLGVLGEGVEVGKWRSEGGTREESIKSAWGKLMVVSDVVVVVVFVVVKFVIWLILGDVKNLDFKFDIVFFSRARMGEG